MGSGASSLACCQYIAALFPDWQILMYFLTSCQFVIMSLKSDTFDILSFVVYHDNMKYSSRMFGEDFCHRFTVKHMNEMNVLDQ